MIDIVIDEVDKLHANLGEGYKLVIDLQPGPQGEHRKARLFHHGHLVARMRVSSIERVVPAIKRARECKT